MVIIYKFCVDSSNNANKQNENKLKTKESYSNYPIPVVTLHCAVTQSTSRQINTTCNGCGWVSMDDETSKMEDCVEMNKRPVVQVGCKLEE